VLRQLQCRQLHRPQHRILRQYHSRTCVAGAAAAPTPFRTPFPASPQPTSAAQPP
jgi:hypothetical protein